MTPLEYYRDQLIKKDLQEDPEQRLVLQCFESLYQKLLLEQKKRTSFIRYFTKPHLIKGMYLWGGVGVGKTFLMDCFFQSLPFKEKLRCHFHHFMQRIHDALKQHQGQVDPLQSIAEELSRETMVLCFDEFLVSDITDAMLLGRLLKALFLKGVTLVATSNTEPDKLYQYGLQRSQFLPAIELIKKNTEVIYIPSKMDYRLRHLKEAGVFYSPLNQDSALKMQKTFDVFTKGENTSVSPIEIFGREIKIIKRTDTVIWFDFKDICSIPRSQHDYLAIANTYRTVLISNIPVIPENAIDTIRLFVNLVDVFYDAGIKLIISAAEPIPELYSRGNMILDYARTHSRLLEMQSMNYFNNEES
ncbi:MAG TPA: cell division protein ZapE [Gammaproteobacteria bacterium]|jgi:cell division protein ZapE|nr:cell division protein ZapE [Gammaproteobacteria bacterium]